ncbi:MAG: hypothetical protein CVV50_04420, partial [Spirochaetae bacterium HGW-Spirochaetae-6]
KDLAKKYSFSIQDILKDIFSSEKSSFTDDKKDNSSAYYEKLLAALHIKIKQLASEMKELKSFKTTLEEKLHQARQKEEQNRQRNHDNKYENEREEYYQKSRYKNQHSQASGFDDQLAKHYAALELPYGADLKSVQKAYRALLKKYHPDYYAHDIEKQQTATLITQKITDAYQVLKKHLS